MIGPIDDRRQNETVFFVGEIFLIWKEIEQTS